MTTAVATELAGQILQENLGKGLGIVKRFAATRTTLPIATNILLKADSGRLRLAATDLEMYCALYVGWMCESEGAVTLPAERLVSMVAAMGPVSISLRQQARQVKLAGGGADFTASAMDAGDYPLIGAGIVDAPVATLDPLVLREALSRVEPATGDDDTRKVLTGVSLRSDERGIALAASDGFRLHIDRLDVPGLRDPFDVILPARLARETVVMLGAVHEPVTLHFDAARTKCAFRLTDIEWGGQLIQGDFPNFSRLIPSEHIWSATCSSSDLQRAVRAAAVFAADGRKRISLQGRGNALSVQGAAAEIGDADVAVPADVAGPLATALNMAYLSDAIAACAPGPMEITGTQPNAQIVVRPTDAASRFSAILMPILD